MAHVRTTERGVSKLIESSRVGLARVGTGSYCTRGQGSMLRAGNLPGDFSFREARMGAAGAGAAAAIAAAAAVANAIQASGVIVRVDVANFMAVLARTDTPLVVVAEGGFFKKEYRYLTSYKGLAFFTKSPSVLVLPPHAEAVVAGKISIPEL